MQTDDIMGIVLLSAWIVLFLVFIAHNIVKCATKPKTCANCGCAHHGRGKKCANEIAVNSQSCTTCKHRCHGTNYVSKKCKAQVSQLKDNWVSSTTQKKVVVGYETKKELHVYEDTWICRNVEVPIEAMRKDIITVNKPITVHVDCGCQKCSCSTCSPNQTRQCSCDDCACRWCKYELITRWANLIIPLILIPLILPIYIALAGEIGQFFVDRGMGSVADYLFLTIGGVAVSIPVLCCCTLWCNFYGPLAAYYHSRMRRNSGYEDV